MTTIKQSELSKMTKAEIRICDNLISKRGRRDDDTQYHLILEQDADIIRRNQIIGSMLRFKLYDIHSKSTLHKKLEKMIVNQIFALFISIKKKYKMNPPSQQYLEKFGQIIYQHPRVSELY